MHQIASFFCIRWPKNWSFSFSISPSSEYSGLISFRIDWFDLLAVQGLLRVFSNTHSSRASILQHSAFFMVQFSQLYRLLEKPTVPLTIQTFVGTVISLVFNTLSRFVIVFIPSGKHLISWLQSPSAAFWSPRK